MSVQCAETDTNGLVSRLLFLFLCFLGPSKEKLFTQNLKSRQEIFLSKWMLKMNGSCYVIDSLREVDPIL